VCAWFSLIGFWPAYVVVDDMFESRSAVHWLTAARVLTSTQACMAVIRVQEHPYPTKLQPRLVGPGVVLRLATKQVRLVAREYWGEERE
jgi:hypothetical protein